MKSVPFITWNKKLVSKLEQQIAHHSYLAHMEPFCFLAIRNIIPAQEKHCAPREAVRGVRAHDWKNRCPSTPSFGNAELVKVMKWLRQNHNVRHSTRTNQSCLLYSHSTSSSISSKTPLLLLFPARSSFVPCLLPSSIHFPLAAAAAA